MAVFALAQLAFVAISCLAMAVPNSPIRHNLKHDIATGTLRAKDYPLDRNGGVIDKYSDCVAASMGLSGNYLNRLAYSKIYYTPSSGCPVVIGALTGRSKVQAQTYFRYWEGWLAISRPLLAVGGLLALEVASGVLLIAALLYLLMQCWRILGRAPALAVGSVILLTTNFIWLPLSFLQALSMAAAIATAAAAMSWTSTRGAWFTAPMLAGCTLCFFDQLMSQTFAWILTTGLLVAVAVHRDIRPSKAAPTVAAGWMTGYAATWTTKWFLILVLLGPHALSSGVFHEIGFRVSTAGFTWWDPFRLTLSQWIGGGHHRYLVPVACLALIATLLAVLVHVRQTWRVALPIAAPALLTPLWYLAVRNHSSIHAFFTYRDWAASLAVVLLGLTVASNPSVARRARRWAQRGHSRDTNRRGETEVLVTMGGRRPVESRGWNLTRG